MAARRVIYDAETHTIIHALAAPLLKAADLDLAGVDIVVIVDPDINAFVAGGPYIFINTGLILAAKNVTDERYFRANFPDLFGTTVVLPELPRHYQAKISYKF